MDYDVIIVGAGLSGLACATTLQQNNLSFIILEAGDRPGGRIQTDTVDGYLLDHGFQVLQTGYPEAKRMLDYDDLHLRKFPSGVAVRSNGKFHIIADPRHHPRYLLSTVASPIGTLKDRLAMAQLARFVCSITFAELFEQQEQTTLEFLRTWGFSENFITTFFVPFFAGASLDQSLSASSRVLQYIFRVFAQGDATLPARGMAEIPEQLASQLPQGAIRYNSRVVNVAEGNVTIESGEVIHCREVVLATASPPLQEFCSEIIVQQSVSECCLYFTADWHPPFREPFLVLNGEGKGPINNIAFPSLVAPDYSTSGKTLISVVALGKDIVHDSNLEQSVREQCLEWFGSEVEEWQHLRTYSIDHALPMQKPPTSNPYRWPEALKPGLRICGEYQSLPGTQWALLSGRQTAEAIAAET